MQRNTAVIIAILSVTAALLIGLTIGRRLSGNSKPIINLPAQTGDLQPSPTSQLTTHNSSPSPSPAGKFFSHPQCGLSFTYPADFQLSSASDSVQLTNTLTNEQINLICGIEFPRPPLAKERIETATIAGQPATIYHDASARDGTPVDVVAFNHPENGLEIALFGFGEVFASIISSISLF